MVLFLGRAGLRMAGVAARSLLAGSRLPKVGAGCQFPSAGVRAVMSWPPSPLPPKASSLFALAGYPQARAVHTVVVVIVKDTTAVGPVYAERISKVIKEEISSLDRELFPEGIDGRTPGSVSDEKDFKLKTLLPDHNDNVEGKCVAAIKAMGKEFDLALYGVKWQQESIFKKLDARLVGQSSHLEDLCNDLPVRNFLESFYLWAGQKIFHPYIIQAKRQFMIYLPYGSRYYFYGMFAYSLVTSDIHVYDWGILFLGAQWFAAKELTDKLQRYHKFYLNGGKEEDDPKKGAQKGV